MFIKLGYCQGCSLGLERLGLEAVSRRFLERLGLVSVLKVERLVSSRFWEVVKMERLGLVSVLKVDRLGLVSVLWLNVLWTSLAHSTAQNSSNKLYLSSSRQEPTSINAQTQSTGTEGTVKNVGYCTEIVSNQGYLSIIVTRELLHKCKHKHIMSKTVLQPPTGNCYRSVVL